MQENEVYIYKVQNKELNGQALLATNKEIEDSITKIFFNCGFDIENYGKETWNPLRKFISPGQCILIKPNMVLEKNHQTGEDYHSVITHPQIIKTVTYYVYKALNGKGKITIADAPINSADFNQLCLNMGLIDLKNEYALKGFIIDVLDFRVSIINKNKKGIIKQIYNNIEKDDYIEIELKDESALHTIDHHFNNFRVTEYNPSVMKTKHNRNDHSYCFHKSILEADVLISLPKIKTHRKAGFTSAMKNFIGLNGNKDYLPHHTKFSKSEGGDEYLYSSFRKRMISKLWEIRWQTQNELFQKILLGVEKKIIQSKHFKPFKDDFFEGSWWGNQTIPKTICDINRVVLYADKKGRFSSSKQREILYLVDGIVCGEGEGPMQVNSKICNVLLWGYNAYFIDLVVAKIIGFDHKKIPTLQEVTTIKNHPIIKNDFFNVNISSNLFRGVQNLTTIRKYIHYNFVPTKGWKNHIELE